MKFDTSIRLDIGKSYLAFKGKDVNLKFDLLFANIDKEKIDYFSFSSEKNVESAEKFENDNIDSSNFDDKSTGSVNKENLLKEVSVTYTNKDDDCSILDTTLDENTKIKVLIKAAVSNIDDSDSLTFDGFELLYKTQDDNIIKVLNYETNEFALRDYEWQDSFVQEIDLPKGTNELIYTCKKGTNYNIELNIQILQAD